MRSTSTPIATRDRSRSLASRLVDALAVVVHDTIPSQHASVFDQSDKGSILRCTTPPRSTLPTSPTRSNPIKARTEPHYLVGGFIAALCVADVGSRSSLAFTACASAMNALACSDCGSIAVKGAPAFHPASYRVSQLACRQDSCTTTSSSSSSTLVPASEASCNRWLIGNSARKSRPISWPVRRAPPWPKM